MNVLKELFPYEAAGSPVFSYCNGAFGPFYVQKKDGVFSLCKNNADDKKGLYFTRTAKNAAVNPYAEEFEPSPVPGATVNVKVNKQGDIIPTARKPNLRHIE